MVPATTVELELTTMPSDRKRKIPPAAANIEEPARRRFDEDGEVTNGNIESSENNSEQVEAGIAKSDENTKRTDQAAMDRQERFKALKARQALSRTQNRKETASESQRLATDPNLLHAVHRKHAIASHKLLKAETAAEGDDFERKRAWDWTIEESEKWDRRMAKKEKHREDVAFQDYRQDARKIYKRQMRNLKPNMEAYEKEKAAAIKRAAESGGLEVVETDDGELVAVDKNGAFYSTADSTDFVQNKPDRAAVDRLVDDLRKAEEVRLRKRKERGKGEDEGDITYINDKNKQFNQKLARFYNKYTTDIRENFERGTAI